jgi:hypothetical protein
MRDGRVLQRMVRLQAGRLLVPLLTVALLQACSLLVPVGADNQGGPGEGRQVFRGAWFEVRYPADFTVKPSLPSATAAGYDSAEFVSPDGAVSFYLFAPQWGGTAADIDLLPGRERLICDRSLEKADGRWRWFTIEAADGSYRRSYLETIAQQGAVRTVVGIKYRDEAARQRYLKEYLQFRQSLEQFAD